MVEQEKKPAVAGKKKHYRFGGRPNPQPKSSPYTSNVAEIKDEFLMWAQPAIPQKLPSP